jgi:DNA-binding beta-propeller fold protein YncE
MQMLSIFDAQGSAPYVSERTSSNLTVIVDDPANQTLTTKIIKTDVSEEGFIYALQENNKMVVYEAFDYYKYVSPMSKIVKRWEQSFPELAQDGQN